MPTNLFSIKPLKVKLLAGEQKATEKLWFSFGLRLKTPKNGHPPRKTDPNQFFDWQCATEQGIIERLREPPPESARVIHLKSTLVTYRRLLILLVLGGGQLCCKYRTGGG